MLLVNIFREDWNNYKYMPDYIGIMTIFKDIFGDTSRIRILDFFLEHPKHEFTTNDIAEYFKMSGSRIRAILHELKPYSITWCGNDRFDKWKLNLSNDVIMELMGIIGRDVVRKNTI